MFTQKDAQNLFPGISWAPCPYLQMQGSCHMVTRALSTCCQPSLQTRCQFPVSGSFPRSLDLLPEMGQQGLQLRPRRPQANWHSQDSAPQGQCISKAHNGTTSRVSILRAEQTPPICSSLLHMEKQMMQTKATPSLEHRALGAEHLRGPALEGVSPCQLPGSHLPVL